MLVETTTYDAPSNVRDVIERPFEKHFIPDGICSAVNVRSTNIWSLTESLSSGAPVVDLFGRYFTVGGSSWLKKINTNLSSSGL